MFLVWAILLLSILVFVHELGHFTVAKLTGVKVIAFSIGFGPRLVKFRFGETEYRICAIPMGGYVKLLGQEASEDIPAGIVNVRAGSPAAEAGLQTGDLVIGADGREVANWQDLYDTIMGTGEETVAIEIERDGRGLVISLPIPEEVSTREAPEFGTVHGRELSVTLPEIGLTIGDHPGELAVAFFPKPLWVRFAVVFAGPLASLTFPFFIYMTYFVTVDELTSNRVGQVLIDSPAYEAGIEPGDRILSVNGVDTPTWTEMASEIKDYPNQAIQIVVQRGDKAETKTITPEATTFRSQIGEMLTQGRIGIAATTLPPLLGVSGNQTPAYRAGLRTGDSVMRINGSGLTFVWQLQNVLEKARQDGGNLTFDVHRPGVKGGVAREHSFTVVPEKLGDRWYYGLASADTVVGKVDEGSPAATAGLRPGDQVMEMDGRRISAWMVIESKLREAQEKPLTFKIMRNGEIRTVSIAQTKDVSKGEFGEEVTRFHFGAFPSVSNDQWLEGDSVAVNNTLGFAIVASANTLVDITQLNLRMFAMIFSGEVPFKMVGGPILIFDIAGRAAEKGLHNYLWIMALISINLGILNLLPIPVLDGGHLMFYTIEFITRRPLNQRIKDRAIMVGFILLMSLMLMVFINDIGRYWDKFFG